MKEPTSDPHIVAEGFGCNCNSEKVIFCFNKRTGERTWNCTGNCFEGNENNNNSPILSNSVQAASQSIGAQTEDETSLNSKFVETEVSAVDSSERLTSLFTNALEVCKRVKDTGIEAGYLGKQYVMTDDVIYCISGADDVDLEPVPITDEPEGHAYCIHTQAVGSNSFNAKQLNHDDDDDDDDEEIVDDDNDDDDYKIENDCEADDGNDDDEEEEIGDDDDDDDDYKIDNDSEADDGNDDDDDYVSDDYDEDDGTLFKCPYCDKTSNSQAQHKKHIKTHTNNDAFKCNLCNRVFKKEGFLTRHQRTVHQKELGEDEEVDHEEQGNESQNNDEKIKKRRTSKNNKLKCDNCEESFTRRIMYEKHIKTHAIPQPLKCAHCGIVFRNKKKLEDHQKEHVEEEIQCIYCEKFLFSRNAYKKHILTHPKPRSLKCPKCDKVFKTAYLFAKHREKHLQERRCDVCDKVCKNDRHFEKHQMTHINQQEPAPPQPEITKFKLCLFCEKIFTNDDHKEHMKIHANQSLPKPPFKCAECDKVSNSLRNFQRHMRTHTGEKPFKCTFSNCSKAFAGVGELRLHLRRHIGDKRYQCERCKKRFLKKENLDEHFRTHTGARPFKCEYCDRSFGFKNVLKVHLAQHTGNKPHQCPHCENKYITKGLLDMHLVSHTGERPHKCLQCDKTFVYKGSLRDHVQMHVIESSLRGLGSSSLAD